MINTSVAYLGLQTWSAIVTLVAGLILQTVHYSIRLWICKQIRTKV